MVTTSSFKIACSAFDVHQISLVVVDAFVTNRRRLRLRLRLGFLLIGIENDSRSENQIVKTAGIFIDHHESDVQ